MTSEKSTWKRNKLLTARRNYFDLGGGMQLPVLQPPTLNIDATQYMQNNIPTTLQPIPGTRGALQPITMPTQAPGIDATKALENGVLQGLQPMPTPSKKETSGDAVKNTNSDWAMGGIAGGIGFLADATTNMVNNINASGVKAKKKELLTQTNNAQMKGQAANDSFDALANDMATTASLKKVDKYDLGAKKAGAIVTEGLTEGLKGSMAGFSAGSAIEGMAGAGAGATGPGLSQGGDGQLAALMGAYGGRLGRPNKYMGGGPIGAIVGGVLGTGMSLVGNLINNHKAKKAAQEVNKQIEYTNDFNQRSMMNRAENLTSSQLAGLEAVYAAFGGPLANWDGAIGYQFMQDYLNSKRMQAEGQDEETQALPTTSSMNVLRAFGGNLGVHGGDFTNGLTFIDEGGSHESNPYEGVPMGVDSEGTPNLVEEGETIYNDYVFSKRLKVPQAIRTKYKMRGTKDLSFAEASKKMAKESEERPNDPISQRGLEAMLQDLAMSQEMLKAEKGSRQYANGGRKFDDGGWTPTTINSYGYIKDGYYGLGDTPSWIQDGNYTQEYKDFIGNTYNSNMFKQHLKDQFSFYDNANATGQGKDSNRYKAIKYFVDANPDWYNNRATIDSWNIDSNLMGKAQNLALSKPGFMHPETVASQYLNAANPSAVPTTPPAERTAQTRHWLMQKDEAGTPMDPILIDDYDASKYTYLNTKNTSDDTTDYTDHYYNLKPETVADVADEEAGAGAGEPLYLGRNKNEWLRYAPVVGFGIGALTDLLGITNKPDYSNADLVINATRGSITPQVGFKPIGNYLARQPMDREFYINQLNAQSGAGRRAIAQNAGLNRGAGMAALLAADNNAQNQLGLFARQAEEYNREDRHKVEDFNRSTNMFNSEGFLKADMANQQAAQAGRDFALRGTIAAAEMRERAKNTADAAKSANLSGLFQSLGDIGYEAKNDNMLRRAIEAGVYGPGAQRVYRDDEIRAMEKSARAQTKAAKQEEKAAQRAAKEQAKLDKEIERFRETGKMSRGLKKALSADELTGFGPSGIEDYDWLDELSDEEYQDVMRGISSLIKKDKKKKTPKSEATEEELLGALTWYNPDLTVRTRKSRYRS